MKNLLTAVFLLLTLVVVGQRPDDSKDDPQSRADFELLRLQDPVTRDIPRGIYQKEREFMRMQNSRVRSDVSQDWINRGPFNVGGRTRALAVDINDENIILAGGVSGGVWRSDDQGESWVKTTSTTSLQSTSCIAQDRREGFTDIWYYGTGEISGNSAGASGAPYRGDGIFKSIDGGLTWNILPSTSTNLPQTLDHDFDYNFEIVVNPVNGNVVVANYGGVYQSTDGGLNFTKILAGSTWTDVAVTSDGILYASVPSTGLWRSVDNGANWTNLTTNLAEYDKVGGNRKEIAIAPSNENIVYVLGLSSTATSGYMIWKYDHSNDPELDGIGTWSNRSTSVPTLGGASGNFDAQGGYDLLIKVKPDDENFVVIGGTNLFSSSSGFITSVATKWIGGYTALNDGYSLYTNHHPDQHAFVFLSGNSAISGNDGGVQLTLDIRDETLNAQNEGVDWIWKNNGYLTSQAYAISIGPGDQIMAGFQDNSTWLTLSGDSESIWTDQFGGDGAYNAFNSDGTMRWMSSQNANIYRVLYSDANSDIANGFVNFTPSVGYSTSLFITPFYLDPLDDNLFYLGGASSLFVNTQALTGRSNTGWKQISLGATGVITEIGTTNFGQVIVGTSSGELFRVTNPGGNSIKKSIKGANFPVGYISGIATNPYNPNEILVCFSNYSILSLFHTLDGGTTWTNVSSNLEQNSNGTGNGPSTRSVAIVGNGDKYLVGTSVGLYSTSAINGSGTVWMQESPESIGNTVVEHIVSREDGYVAIGTHGNGMYSTNYTVTAGAEHDLAAMNIITPASGPISVSPVTVRCINLGSSNEDLFDISLYVNNVLVVTDQVQQVVESFTIYEHTFSELYDFNTPGQYTVRFELNLASDLNASNNSYTAEVSSIERISAYPNRESFESGQGLWVADGDWELGIPSATIISRSSDGDNAWVTNLDGNYSPSQTSMLKSPFYDFTNLTKPVVSFDLNFKNEQAWDGMVLGYRENLTQDFTIIGEEKGIQYWYNNTAAVFGRKAWSGTSNGFQNTQADLSFLAGKQGVQFAFIFKSDAARNDEGAAVDNFKICQNCLPTDHSITSSRIMENQPAGTLIGTLSTVDQDDDTHTYRLLSISNFASFTLQDNEVKSNEVFDFEVKTTYTIRISTQDDDGNTFEKWVIVRIDNDTSDDPLAVNELESNGVRLYPNPVKETLNMDLSNDYYGEVHVLIYSIDGKKSIIDRSVVKNTASLRRLVDLDVLPAGLYIIQLKMGDKVLTGKIIKD